MLDFDDLEVKREAQTHVIQMQGLKDSVDQLMNHYSSWTKLKRAVAWFMKLKSLLKELIAKRKEASTMSEEIRMSQFKKAFKGKKSNL